VGQLREGTEEGARNGRVVRRDGRGGQTEERGEGKGWKKSPRPHGHF